MKNRWSTIKSVEETEKKSVNIQLWKLLSTSFFLALALLGDTFLLLDALGYFFLRPLGF